MTKGLKLELLMSDNKSIWKANDGLPLDDYHTNVEAAWGRSISWLAKECRGCHFVSKLWLSLPIIDHVYFHDLFYRPSPTTSHLRKDWGQ